ncbi:hypothetical protein H9P43_009522 [Blastocladiella emersonii ATCC 22665]|nr:hypothetical protein H9P43_009522 [Blastocladiella emersonii ATCC 22665]
MTLAAYFRKTPEIVPLIGFVSVVASFAVYSTVHKIVSDQDLRIRPNHGHITWQERVAMMQNQGTNESNDQ